MAAPLEASPAGSDVAATCPVAAPCSLARAVALAVSGDVITAQAGDYALAAALTLTSGVELRGAPGPRPTITAPAAGGHAVLAGNPTPVAAPVATLRHVRLVSPNGGATLRLGRGALGEDLVVEASGADSAAVLIEGPATLRSSLVVARGNGGTAAVMAQSTPSVIFSISAVGTVRNVTAIATSPTGRGLLVYGRAGTGISPGSCSTPIAVFNLRNVIARGGGADIQLDGQTAGSCLADSQLDVDHSNFRSVAVSQTAISSPATAVINGFHNQTSAAQTADAAVFADAAYHQAANSPTIDAGIADQLAPTDIDGEPVPMRAAPDIGADEIAPAPPAAPAAPVAVPTTAPALRLYSGVTVAKRITLASLLRRGLPVSFSLEQPRSAYRLTLSAPAKGLARRAVATAVRRRTLATAAAGNQAAGATTLTVRLPKAARTALVKARALPRLTLRIRVSVPGGLSQTSTRTITLTR